MKITCSVIQDLLPLYAENLACDDTRRLVEEHIDLCPNCQSELKKIKRLPTAPSSGSDRRSLAGMRRYLFRQRLLAACLAAALLLAIGLSALAVITTPIYFPYAKDQVSVTAGENGAVTVRFAPEITHREVYQVYDEEADARSVTLWTWTTRLDRWRNAKGAEPVVLTPREGEGLNLWYCFEGAEDHLIYGKIPQGQEGQIHLPRLALTYYLLIALATAGVLGILLLLLQKYKWPRRILWAILPLPLCYIAAQIMVKGFDFSSYAMLRDIQYILWIALPLYMASLTAIFLIRRRRENLRSDL